MMKTLRYLFLAVLTMTFGMAQADDIVINFNGMDIPTSSSESEAGDITEDWTYTQDGVTIVVTPKEEGVTNPNRFWSTNNGPQLRCYSGTITISYTSSMKNITFNVNASKFALSANTGVIEGKVWTGSGETQRVVFSVDGNTQLNSITITPGVGNGQEEPPVEDEPTFDFTKEDYGLTHTVAESDNKDYYLEDGTTFTSGDVTGTLSGNNPARLWETTAGVTEFRLYKSGTLTLSVPSGKVITKVVFAGATVSGLVGPDGQGLTNATWEGSLNAPKFTCTATQKINTITVTYGTGSEIPVETVYTDMTMREATAKSLENSPMKNINLKLNNALVVYDFVKGNNEGFFVREGDFAIEFYNTGLGLKAGQTITGSIKCNLSPYNNSPEVVKADDPDATNLDNVTLGTGSVSPTEMEVDALYNCQTHVGDLVLVKNAPIITEVNESTQAVMYYIQTSIEKYDSDQNFTGYETIRLYDYFGDYTFPEAETTMDIKGILVANAKTTRRIWPIAENNTTAIQTIQKEQAEGTVFNLQGQRVSQPTHGIYIVNGKKIMMK